MLSNLQKQSNVTILWDQEVTGIKDDGGLGDITVNSPDGPKHLRARFVIGCDGANSKIRRLLFGDWEFPGKTWVTQVVATNVYHDFRKYGYDDANCIKNPEHWYMASRITRDGMWRVAYGESVDLTVEELRAQQPAKWKQMLPGKATPENYRIANFSPYKKHQRLAPSMRVGPLLLAADAAHCWAPMTSWSYLEANNPTVCNPFGGLGLTGEIVDVGGLADCLIGLSEDKAEDGILDIYSRVRREKYQPFVDLVLSANLVRMSDSQPATISERDKSLRMMKLLQVIQLRRKR